MDKHLYGPDTLYFPDTFKEFINLYSVTAWKRRIIEVDVLKEGLKHYFILIEKENPNG